MTVKIRQTSITNPEGTFNLNPDAVRMDLMIIADLDGSFGESPDPADANFTVIEFNPAAPDTSTAAGRVHDQLLRLVNRSSDLELHGLRSDFVYGDGTTVETRPGSTFGSTTIFYDTENCDGDGRWIVGTNGDRECTTSAGILHHEMGHALLSSADPLHPESDAIVQENDLRARMGLVARDVADGQSGCGCPDSGCCIIASVASGSPYSAEVHALRKVRDRMLRGTRLGAGLFDALFEEYYRFSVPVSRAMVTSDEARENVERWLVKPLIRALEVALEHVRRPEEPEHLGRLLLQDAAGDFPMSVEALGDWSKAAFFIACVQQPGAAEQLGASAAVAQLDPRTVEIATLLARDLPNCPHVIWAILQPLQIYAEARDCAETEPDARVLGDFLTRRLNRWLSAVPLTGWEGATPQEVGRDLALLRETVLTNPAVFAAFERRRLAAGLGPSGPAEGREER